MRKLFFYLSMIVLLGSCIQSEPLNTEADIVSCKVLNADGTVDPYIKGNVILTNRRVMAQANPKIDLTKLALQVKLTEGATITPDPGVVRNYSLPQHFVVTSQDGVWKKSYTVSVDTFEMPTKYFFDFYELNETGKFQVFYEKVFSQDTVYKQYIWSSGNSGYALTGVGNAPEDYPTVSLEKGKTRKGIKLETKSTGPFGETVKMPIAAGNLFIGSFDVMNAVAMPLKATLFGLPFGKKPERFRGWYKYKPGSGNFISQDQNKNMIVVNGEKDAGDIYAVLYEAEGLEENALNGNNVLTSPNLVAMARVEDIKTTDDFVYFDIKFKYRGEEPAPIVWPSFIYNRKTDEDGNGQFLAFDQQKLESYKYNLAIVFTSSKYGAYFAGVVGSTLCIDDVEVVCK